MTASFVDSLSWEKAHAGLLPAIAQDAEDGRVLMTGFMNREAVARTLETGRVVWFSRSKNRLWTKGESSGNFLDVVDVSADCDRDAILVRVRARGPTCHTGARSCFDAPSLGGTPVIAPPSRRGGERIAFLEELEETVGARIRDKPDASYTAKLVQSGRQRIAQKVGEEGVEVALAAMGEDDDALVGEVADLVYHVIVLLKARNLDLARVVAKLESRAKEKEGRARE